MSVETIASPAAALPFHCYPRTMLCSLPCAATRLCFACKPFRPFSIKQAAFASAVLSVCVQNTNPVLTNSQHANSLVCRGDYSPSIECSTSQPRSPLSVNDACNPPWPCPISVRLPLRTPRVAFVVAAGGEHLAGSRLSTSHPAHTLFQTKFPPDQDA